MKKFISTERKGFKMTFENGLTISVQWGYENYCSNKCFTIDELDNTDFSCTKDIEADTAEVAIMIGNKFVKPYLILPNYRNTSSLIIGYQTPEEVLDIMNKVRQFDPKIIENNEYFKVIIAETN